MPCSIAPEMVVSHSGFTFHVWVSAMCKFTVSVPLELLKATLACKLNIARDVVSGYANG